MTAKPQATWSAATTFEASGTFREERPSLGRVGSCVGLAWLRTTDQGTTVMRADTCEGSAWSEARSVSDGPVLPHVSPQWSSDGTLVWAEGELGADARLCAEAWTGDEAACSGLGQVGVDGVFARASGELGAAVRAEGEAWAFVDLRR